MKNRLQCDYVMFEEMRKKGHKLNLAPSSKEDK